MPHGDDAIITALTHMSSEIKGLRIEVRKVIELEAESRTHKEALGRAFAEIGKFDARTDALAVRVSTLEGQGPISHVVRIAVFSMIALAVGALLTALFSVVLRAPPASAKHDNHNPPIGPARQAEQFPRSQP